MDAVRIVYGYEQRMSIRGWDGYVTNAIGEQHALTVSSPKYGRRQHMALFPSKRQPQKPPPPPAAAAAPRTVSLDVVHLPEPDAWGNYWLSLGSDRTQGPCILHHSIPGDQASKAVSSEDVKWFISWGGDKGILFDGPKIRYFPNPEAALKVMQGNK